MLNILDAIKALYNNDILPLVSENVPKDLVIYFPGLNLTIETDQIVDDSFSLEEKLCSDTDLVFGSCEASVIKFTLADVEQDLSGQRFIINQIINGCTVPLGVYTVDSCKKRDDLRFKDIVAYDNMKITDVDVSEWYNSLTFPLTLAAFRASLLNYFGIAEEARVLPNDSMTVTKTISPSKLKGRDVLIACEEINGCFGHINRYGKFAHIVLEPSYGLYPAVTLFPSDKLYPVSETDTSYFEQSSAATPVSTSMCIPPIIFEEYTVKEIDKLQIRREEGDIGAIAGIGTNAYVIEGNFLVYGKSAKELNTIAINAFGNMQKRPYRPYQSNNVGLPYIEVGDTIAFNLTDVIAGYIFKRTLTGIQALRDAFTAEGNEEREQNFSVNKEIIQLQGKTNVLKRTVEELSSTITDVEAGLESKITQTAGQLQTQITDNENDANSKFTQQAAEIELRVEKSGIVAAINVTPETIKIAANKLELSGYATFTSLANAGETIVNGSNVTTGTIDADLVNVIHVKAESVESDWVYAGEINANQITVGTLSGDRINGGIIKGVQILSTFDGVTLEMNRNSFHVSVNTGGDSYNSFLQHSYVTFQSSANSSYASYGRTGIIIHNTSGNEVFTVNSSGDIECRYINDGTPITSDNRDDYINILYDSTGDGAQVTSNGNNFRPHSNYGNDRVSCGSPSYRWTQVFAASSTISTSDGNLKDSIGSLTDAEKRVAQRIKQLFITFKFKDAVSKKGDNARIHVGIIAQDVKAAFEAEGLNPYEYAMFCSDTWYEKDGKAVDENENSYTANTEGVVPVTRLSLRYEEVYGFIFAAT